MNLNELRDKAYKIACEHGFHDQELSDKHCLMLVITELSEAVEADRKGKYANVPENKIGTVFDSRFFHEENISFIENFEKFVKDTVEDELSDTVIRLLDFAGSKDVDLSGYIFDLDEETLNMISRYSFPERVFFLCRMTTDPRYFDNLAYKLSGILFTIMGICSIMNFDLEWHVEKKMMYNSLRKKMHGKKY